MIRSYRDVVAICDEDLIGKKFEDTNFQLDIKEQFYKGEKFSEDKVKEFIKSMLNEDATFNIVGKDSIKIALESGIISREDVKKIDNIPFSLVLA